MESLSERRKKIRQLKRLIYGRTIVILLAVLVQLTMTYFMFAWLSSYSNYIYIGMLLISAVVVLHLFNDPGVPDFKLAWFLPIALIPVFGGLFYLFMEIQPGVYFLKRKVWKNFEADKGKMVQDPHVRNRIREHDHALDGMAQYLLDYDNSPAFGYTEAKYFSLGDEWFPDLIEELKKAERFIFMEYFILEDGQLWDSVLQVLKKKAEEGVEVRVMYDGMCSLSVLPTFYPKLLEKEGIKCRIFSPIHPIFSTRYNNRDHRKITVIDGRVAYTGGTNLADEYINQKERFGHWKDCAVKMKGDCVRRFTFMFLEMWKVSGSDKDHEGIGLYDTPKDAYANHDGYCIPYEVIPYGKEHVGKRVYLDLMNTTAKYLHIMTPYLVIDYETTEALCYAAKRGADVKIIMPGIPDKKYAFILAKTYYPELLRAGVRIYEYTPGFVHSKLFVSDDEKAVVGSVNLDYRSFYHHFECGAFFYRNSEILKMEEDFNETLKKCEEVTPESLKKQKFFETLGGKILRMIASLM
ncbi:MAG: cardiolipin synthase [Acetatifactor sp.]|nr:cardiolipin synthase [Acetatifactor sp.]